MSNITQGTFLYGSKYLKRRDHLLSSDARLLRYHKWLHYLFLMFSAVSTKYVTCITHPHSKHLVYLYYRISYFTPSLFRQEDCNSLFSILSQTVSFSLGKRDSFIWSPTFYSKLLISTPHSFWWRQPSSPFSPLFHYFLTMNILILLWVSWLIHD